MKRSRSSVLFNHLMSRPLATLMNELDYSPTSAQMSCYLSSPYQPRTTNTLNSGLLFQSSLNPIFSFEKESLHKFSFSPTSQTFFRLCLSAGSRFDTPSSSVYHFVLLLLPKRQTCLILSVPQERIRCSTKANSLCLSESS